MERFIAVSHDPLAMSSADSSTPGETCAGGTGAEEKKHHWHLSFLQAPRLTAQVVP